MSTEYVDMTFAVTGERLTDDERESLAIAFEAWCTAVGREPVTMATNPYRADSAAPARPTTDDRRWADKVADGCAEAARAALAAHPAPTVSGEAVEAAARRLYVRTAKDNTTHDEAVVPWADLHPYAKDRWLDYARDALTAALGITVADEGPMCPVTGHRGCACVSDGPVPTVADEGRAGA